MLLYGELLAAALRYRYATHKVFTSSTDIILRGAGLSSSSSSSYSPLSNSVLRTP
ncbi:hypothetical protein H6F39_20145 [Anabaena sp. FACHB-1250]|uniref:hypothetical protein n=1 Tax=Anabaena sp. FACHB-1250 TaxID=2692770 RepID=UPI001680366B|nr:hypothetical protein [Anabaena sp. FACHB-1250]MBD2143593.1 hypothetical protein [Anabaena sp. FACHB-1250]